MGIEIFRKENWDRWMDDEFIRQDSRRMDKHKDKCLLEYIAIYGEGPAEEWAMRELRVSGCPVSVGGIEGNRDIDKADQRWLVMREQVMRETDYRVLEEAAYEAPRELSRFAFSRLTGCGRVLPGVWHEIEVTGCGLKQGVSRSDIEELCREMMRKNGPLADEAAAWLEELAGISDEELAELAAPRTERSWDNDPAEKLKRFFLDTCTGETPDAQSAVSGSIPLDNAIREIYDAYIFNRYAGIYKWGSSLILDLTMKPFGSQVIRWFEKRGRRPVTLPDTVRLVLSVCGVDTAGFSDEKIRGIARTETEDKLGHGYYIGLDLLYGFDTEGDAAKAVRPLTEAAEAGNRYAIEELISIYEEGIGVKKNPWLAKKWREKQTEV
jgi:hypothetical protein